MKTTHLFCGPVGKYDVAIIGSYIIIIQGVQKRRFEYK